MGVCCSKSDMVKVKETIREKPEDRTLLLQETVGKADNIFNLLNSNSKSSAENGNPSIKELDRKNTEAIGADTKESTAVRSTLIFPSYSGYRNKDQFGVNRKETSGDFAPTAFVAPVQTVSSNQHLTIRTANLQGASPFPSRYSAMISNNRENMSRPGAFELRTAPLRRGSVDSAGFDSDLESEYEDTTFPKEANNGANPDEIFTKSLVGNTADSQHQTSPCKEESVLQRTSFGVGTDDLKDASTQSLGNQSSKNLTSTSVGKEADTSHKNVSSVATATDQRDNNIINKKDEAMFTEVEGGKTMVKMVHASVGTNSDEYFRSTKATEVQVDLKNKPITLSCSTGTETSFQTTNEKSTDVTKAGTDVSISTVASPPMKSDAGTETDRKYSYIKMVDASVGTESDNFYRSKKSRKIQINEKKKKIATLSTGTGTSTDSSPKILRKPKIITENFQDFSTKKKNSRTSPVPPLEKNEERQEEPHPIIETLENAFMRFAKYGDINGDGKEMNNKNWAKLCRDCEFIDNRHVLVGEVDVIFSRHKQKGYRLINFEMFVQCLNEIADKTYSKKVKDEWARRELIYQRVIGKAPELVGITNISKTGNVERMTDHHLYPASHKMRFDEEGKGLGIEDKFEINDSSLGYVQGYKDRDTYDQKMIGFYREKSGTNMTSSLLPSPRSPQLPRAKGSPQRPQSSASIRS